LFVALGASLAVAQNGRRPEDFQIAIGMQNRGLHEEAVRYLSKFVRENGQHQLVPEAYYRLAQSQIERKQTDAAIDALKKALQRGGARFELLPEARYRLGGLLQEKGDQQGAQQQFTALAGGVADDHYLAAAASYALGETLRDLDRDAPAAEAFGKAAALADGEQRGFRFPSLYQQGFAYLRLNQFDPAAKAFARARDVAPDPAAKGECSYLVGDARLRLEQYGPARQAFEAARKVGGEFADDAQFGLGWVALGSDDRDGALRAFGRLIERHPDSPFVANARLERARCYYQAQQFDRAGNELRPLLAEAGPLQQEARELEGLCALASGKGQAAVQTLEQALAAASDEDKPRLSFALGEALSNLEQWGDALRAYRAVPASAGADLYGDALYGACHALHELGRNQESIQCADAVLQLEPAHRSRVLAQLAIAENRFALREFAAAEQVYQQLEKVDAHRRTARWKLSWCRYLQGDKKGAAERFGAVAKDREDGNAEEAMAMQALALYESGAQDPALQVADRYRARYQQGRFLARTERIAARVLRQRGDLGAAQRRLERAAAIARQQGGDEAGSADVAEQADLAYQQGDYEAADQLFAQLTSRDDATGARALAGRAWCAFELGNDAPCLQALQAARQHPAAKDELPGLLELESAVRHRRQEWPEAIQAARTFLQNHGKHPKAPMLRYALGVALARNGDQKGAQQVLAGLAADGGYREPDRVVYELAWALRRGGDERAALQQFGKVAAMTEDVELAGESRLFVGTDLLAQQPPKLAAARKVLEQVQGSHRKQALYRLGFAEFEAATAEAATAEAGASVDRKLLGAARDHFTEIVGIEGEELRHEALYLGAESCRRLGDAEGALQRAQLLLREANQHARAPRARLVVGECALLADRPDDAIAPLERFLREHDAAADEVARADAARANLWLGKARLQRRQHEQAERCFQQVTGLSDGALAAEAQFRLGESRALRNDLNGAADAFVKIPILYADAEWVRKGLLQAGLTYKRMKQPAKATRFFDELLDKHKGSDEAKVAAAQR
jgi:tetratricopeptide (TPR) repeat protein